MMLVISMQVIDLSLLHSNSIEQVHINEDFQFEEEVYQNTDIKKFNYLHVEGIIKRETDDDDFIDLSVSGEMVLADSISLEDVNYPFSFKIEGSLKEILGNCPNTLDILEILWENIVLEIPLKFTKVKDLSKFHGDGWCLMSEEDPHQNNPFNELLKDFGEE